MAIEGPTKYEKQILTNQLAIMGMIGRLLDPTSAPHLTIKSLENANIAAITTQKLLLQEENNT